MIHVLNFMLAFQGAAVEDGRLRPGDRLLAVDGIDLNGKTQADVVALLRNVQPGASVNLLVSRHVEGMASSPNASMSLVSLKRLLQPC